MAGEGRQRRGREALTGRQSRGREALRTGETEERKRGTDWEVEGRKGGRSTPRVQARQGSRVHCRIDPWRRDL